jgi:hypothetical protein
VKKFFLGALPIHPYSNYSSSWFEVKELGYFTFFIQVQSSSCTIYEWIAELGFLISVKKIVSAMAWKLFSVKLGQHFIPRFNKTSLDLTQRGDKGIEKRPKDGGEDRMTLKKTLIYHISLVYIKLCKYPPCWSSI